MDNTKEIRKAIRDLVSPIKNVINTYKGISNSSVYNTVIRLSDDGLSTERLHIYFLPSRKEWSVNTSFNAEERNDDVEFTEDTQVVEYVNTVLKEYNPDSSKVTVIEDETGKFLHWEDTTSFEVIKREGFTLSPYHTVYKNVNGRWTNDEWKKW